MFADSPSSAIANGIIGGIALHSIANVVDIISFLDTQILAIIGGKMYFLDVVSIR
jgi:hypothetical protein